MRDHKDLVIEELAASEAELQAHVATLVGIIADIAFRNFTLMRVTEKEICLRVEAEGALERTRRVLHKLRDEQKAAAA